MYSLNEHLSSAQGQERGVSVFKPGVNVKFMNLKQQVSMQFRLLPAFDPATMQMKDGAWVPTNLASWVPFRDPQTQNLQSFARPIKITTFIGHGKGKDGRRRDLLSPITFDTGSDRPDSDGRPLCPLTTLFQAAENDPEWMYLIKDAESTDQRFPAERQILSFPSWQMIANIVDVHDPQQRVVLGVFTTSAYNSLLSRRGEAPGLVWQPASVEDPSILINNPLARWACGDLTHPTRGPVLALTKAPGAYGKYGINQAVDSVGNILRLPISDALLEQRYNLCQLETIAIRQTEEELIHELVKVLNGINPVNGQHEWVFLRKVFGSLVGKGVIPDPPAAGYTQGYNTPVAAPAPAAAPVSPPPGLAPAAAPVSPPPALAPAAAGTAAPAGMSLMQQAQYATSAPVSPPPVLAPATLSPEIPVENMAAPAGAGNPEQRLMDTAAAGAATPPGVMLPGQAAPLPGDTAPEYKSDAFLQRLREGNTTPPPQA